MGTPIKFDGYNTILHAPNTMDELSCQDMYVFNNGVNSVSCWQLSEQEVEEIIRTRKIFISVWFGKTQPPIYIGTENDVRDLISDSGVWKKP